MVGDVLNFNLKRKFDLIIMRSSLDYLPSKKLQIIALKNIYKHLLEEGIFINCVAAMPSDNLRNLANKIYSSNNKIGKRFFQSKEDIFEIYYSENFKFIKLIGHSKILKITEKEHIERYLIDLKEVKKIQSLINHFQNNNYILINKKGYLMRFIFPIYLAKKNK